jgi:hypothetical protein
MLPSLPTSLSGDGLLLGRRHFDVGHFGEEGRQAVRLGVDCNFRRLPLGLRRTQWLGQPASAVEQPFGLLGHVRPLQVVDELRRRLALCLGHGLQDPGLGDAAEIVVGGRRPASRGHVEMNRPGETIRMGDDARAAAPRLVDGIDSERSAVGEQGRPDAPIEDQERVPQSAGFARDLPGPAAVTRVDRLRRRGVVEPRRLRVPKFWLVAAISRQEAAAQL